MTATDDAREVLAAAADLKRIGDELRAKTVVGCTMLGEDEAWVDAFTRWHDEATEAADGLARTLLALAEPDEQVVEAAARAMAARISEPEWTEFLDDARAALTAAVAAAEQVNR